MRPISLLLTFFYELISLSLNASLSRSVHQSPCATYRPLFALPLLNSHIRLKALHGCKGGVAFELPCVVDSNSIHELEVSVGTR